MYPLVLFIITIIGLGVSFMIGTLYERYRWLDATKPCDIPGRRRLMVLGDRGYVVVAEDEYFSQPAPIPVRPVDAD